MQVQSRHKLTTDGADSNGISQSELEFQRLLEALPAGAYTCDPGGLITYFNARAVNVWGRAPKLRDDADRWCGSFKLFAIDGSPIRHDECWMARAILEDKEYNGEEIVIERPDGDRITALAHANPLRDGAGTLVGAVNILVDISDRKRAEVILREADQ
ncbi:MAG: PAS domain S-box protein, partial [Gemmatimonadaceae bacterium]